MKYSKPFSFERFCGTVKEIKLRKLFRNRGKIYSTVLVLENFTSDFCTILYDQKSVLSSCIITTQVYLHIRL